MSVVNYPHPNFAIGQVVVLLSSLGFTLALAFKKPQKVWYSTRALAESIKTITWRYAMKAEPFEKQDDEARSHFIRNITRILDANKQAGSHHIDLQGQGQISRSMNELRALPLQLRKDRYLTDRVKDQRAWYASKASLNKRRSKQWFFALVVINAVAILSALLRIEYPHSDNWPTDIFVAGAAAMMGWLQTKRYDELAASYSLTAHEIGLLQDSIPRDDSEDSFSTYVGDAENAFSREHTQWQARRDAE